MTNDNEEQIYRAVDDAQALGVIKLDILCTCFLRIDRILIIGTNASKKLIKGLLC